jgi:mRNA interferase YafQ
MYQIEYTNKMKKDVKLMKKRGKDISKLITVLNLLAEGGIMPLQYKDHALTGNLKDFRECHIEPDWLLKSMIDSEGLVLLR